MPGITREQRDAVLDCRCGNQCVPELQSMRKHQTLHQIDGAGSNRRRDGKLFCATTVKALSDRQHLSLIAHALQEFQVGDRRNLKAWNLVKPLRCFGESPQVPDQQIGVDQQCGRAQSRE